MGASIKERFNKTANKIEFSQICNMHYALMKSTITHKYTVVWAIPNCPAWCSGKRFCPLTGNQHDSYNGAQCLLPAVQGVAVSLCRSPKTSTRGDTETLRGIETISLIFVHLRAKLIELPSTYPLTRCDY